MTDQDFLDRINFKGKITELLAKVCADYNIGKYVSHQIISTGYEDCNIILVSENKKVFVKIFGSFRDEKDCDRYVDLMAKVIDAGVNHPKLFQSSNGYSYKYQDSSNLPTFLCLMEYIDGSSFYDLRTCPNQNEIIKITNQAAIINSLDIKPAFTDDSWAIGNFLQGYEAISKYLDEDTNKLIYPLIDEFKQADFDSLPHSLVHGDLIKTNVLRSKSNKIYLIDFSVANFYPRIQELAILLCNLFFDSNNLSDFDKTYNLVIKTYQEEILLTQEELGLLPLYIKLAHAMHIIGATREKELNGNDSEENEYWLNQGKIGLAFINK
jgi:Ser/Thr protein kinase RdoA (MazF antagonist)